MKKTTVNIKGMHCRSCELLLEDELSKVPGVRCVCADQERGQAELEHEDDIEQQYIESAVQNAGYTLGKDDSPWISHKLEDYRSLGKMALLVFILGYIANKLGLFNIAISSASGYSSLPIVLLVGLTAGFSTCMALVGGLVLAASSRFAEKHPTATSLQKFTPHLFFNLGRIVAFFVLGGLIGLLGSVFQLSTTILGALTIIVGGVMLLLGAQLIDISPRLNKFKFVLPKFIAKALGIHTRKDEEYSNKGSFVSGALTFFLPCGFTQAMQLYAMSSGSPLTGALTMGTFALGTTPGLLGVGGLTSIVKGAFAKHFFRFAGLVVILLALFNLANGGRLAGFSVPSFVTAQASIGVNDPNVMIENGVQIVRMTQDTDGYKPNTFTIRKGMPVKWIVTSKSVTSCAAAISFPKFGIRQGLKLGENIFEFTPTETGSFRFSCLMGMFTGSFTVTDGTTSTVAQQTTQAAVQPAAATGSCGGGGGGCGCGAAARKTVPTLGPEATPIVTTQAGQAIQVIKATYSPTTDITPNSFRVKAERPVRLEILAQENGAGCMGSIALPKLSQNIQVFTKGQTVTFDFTPIAGTYQITCAMGIPRGQIVAE